MVSLAVANRVVMYYQTQYQNGQYVSVLPLIGYVTHLFLAAIHLNMGHTGPDIVHLNNNQPADPFFDPMWPELAQLQGNGTKVIGMLGGAAAGTYDCLVDSLFDTYYPALKDVITTYKLDGIDLDVEQSVSLETITHLIQTLKADFGDDFIITLAPVASALTEGGNLSGFDYIQLEHNIGDLISWYNAQFYSGFGTFFPDDQYIDIVNYDQGIDPPRLTALVLTNPSNGGGYVSPDNVVTSIHELMDQYGTDWGGVGGWEYFNSLPDSSQPWEWPIMMKNAMEEQKTKMEADARTKELAARREAEAQPGAWSRLFSRLSSSARHA
ncbi:endo-beta-N-acetylglucosaminidase [Dichomitus squalens]|uniref:Endo-beta-N-acetylglucosaminidase n=1 Tax=Dichomitus squalens TaxID=114155 RepID=A0A4Q9MLE6_9APHY|nr:endo-beta-N-acetylglucosaminidase [Dichomitus squalens]